MEEEINLLDYWRVIVRWKKTILSVVIAVTFSSALISLFLTKIYKAEATIMPVGGQKGGMSLLAAQGLTGLLSGSVGGTSSSMQLLAILKSRTLAERMVEKYDLMKVFYQEVESGKWKVESREDAVKTLFSLITFTDDKKMGLIAVRAEMKDPQLAARLVNGYLEELTHYINENAFTTAKRNRIFVEEQLARNKADLLESGKELTQFYATNKISNVVPAVDVNVAEGKEVGSGKWKVESGEEKDVQKKTEELQKQAGEVKAQVEKAKVVKDVPQQVYLQYLVLRRELLGQVNALLTQQFEMAKIEEAKEDLNFQVIDWARVPVRKFKPKRTQIVIASFMMSLFAAIFYAFFREYLEKMKPSG